MKILELFCGTKSFSKVAQENGHQTFTIDNIASFNPDLCIDVMNLDLSQLPFKPDIIWASPPCQAFSVATIGRNWNIDKSPKTEHAKQSIKLLEKTIAIIKELKPKYFFIENPRAMMRTLPIMKEFKRNTITYCQYGDSRMKPTDIFNNCNAWISKTCCLPKAKCHISAPRGSRTGTQGLKNATERGVVPKELCLEILNACKN